MESKKDFRELIKRTFKILQQYDTHRFPDDKSYSRTLFINAALCLLVLPSEQLYHDLPEEPISQWEIREDSFYASWSKNIKNFVHHMRNALFHSNFDFDTTVGRPITEITFFDKYPDTGVENFRIKMQFGEFKRFVIKLADFALREE